VIPKITEELQRNSGNNLECIWGKYSKIRNNESIYSEMCSRR